MKFIHQKLLLILVVAAFHGCAITPYPPSAEPNAAHSSGAASSRESQVLRFRNEPLVATGYAVITVQNHKLPAQQRLLAIRAAKIDAYRNLAEQIYGMRLDSSTSIADMAVTSDRFRARVEGVIFGAVLSNITPTDNETYEVTLTLDSSVVNDIRVLYLEQKLSRNGH